MRSLMLMIQFMTRYPLPGQVPFTAERFVEGMKWMPLVGLLVALPATAGFWLVSRGVGSDLAALVAVLLLITVTGGLHLDGIADTADGLFSYRSRERMLEIMRDSTLGTNGVIAVVMAILLKYVVLRTVPVAEGTLAVLLAPVLGRMALTWHAAAAPYARAAGGIGDFVNQTGWPQALAATLGSLLLTGGGLFAFGLPPGRAVLLLLVLHLATIGLAVGFAAYLKLRLGGITGDTIGATIELAELLSLLLLCLVPRFAL